MTLDITAGSSTGTAQRKWKFYPTRLGRDIYNRKSITGLARSTVNDLVNYIVGGIRVGDAPTAVDPRLAAERLLVDGPVVLQAGMFWEDCYCPDSATIIQYERTREGGHLRLKMVDDNMDKVYTDRLRVWELAGGLWVEKLYEKYYTPERQEVQPAADEPALITISEQELVVMPNGRGLVYWAQHVFNTIDEIAETMRNVGSGINLLPIISGDVGDDPASAIASAVNAIIFPGDVHIDRVVSEAIVNQLVRESELARANAVDAMNTIEKDTPDRPVAADRELRSRAMLEFVGYTRKQLELLYERLLTPVRFDPFVIMSPAEQIQKLDVLDRAIAAEAITPQERRAGYREVIGLAPQTA